MMIRVNATAPGIVIQIEYDTSRISWPYAVVLLVNGEPVASVAAKEIKITKDNALYCVAQCGMPLRDNTDVAAVQQFIAETKK